MTFKKKVYITVAAGISLTCFLSVVYHWRQQQIWTKVAVDSIMATSWNGFGEEKGLYNFTVVTALLDIGRGSWPQQSRSYNTYLLYMQRVLRLDVNLVVFVDLKARPFIDWMRRGREKRTRVVLLDVRTLPYYSLKARISEIMASEEYRRDNELVEKGLCESNVPEYDILQLSKLYFMDKAIRENPFSTDYFMWIDGGYGHGADVHPHDGVWIPQNLFEYSNRVTFIERSPGVQHYSQVKHKLHKMSINILAGLFFAGGAEALKELYVMQKKQVAEWMRDGVVDDDQTMYMLLYYQKPSLFHLVPGDWDDVFQLFNARRPPSQ